MFVVDTCEGYLTVSGDRESRGWSTRLKEPESLLREAHPSLTSIVPQRYVAQLLRKLAAQPTPKALLHFHPSGSRSCRLRFD
jgi:hypothetical protein